MLIRCVYLTKVATFFTDGEVAFFIGTPEESSLMHEICFIVIRLLATKADPEKVVRLFALIQNLNAEPLWIVHVFDNIFSYLGLLGIGLGSNPHINNTRSVLRIKWHLQKVRFYSTKNIQKR